MALAKRQLGFAKLTAPSTGAVASVEVSPNENVGAGNPVMMLTAGDAPEVSISVPESMVGRLQSGQLAQARFDALAGQSFQATVQEIGVASTGAATTFPVVLALQGAGDAVRSGMAADVIFSFRRNQSGVAVPSSAVGEDAEGRYVYVLDAAEGDTATVRKVTVAIGDLIDAGLVVTSGLSGGERLISAGQAKVLPGQTVKGTRAPERSQ